MTNKLPKARINDIVDQPVDNEVLLYDLTTHKAFNLNETSTIIYRACDGDTSFDELKLKHNFTNDFILLALDELKRNNLLADEYKSPVTTTNRRELIKKVGLASLIALPLITSLVAPKAAHAQSAGSCPEEGDACIPDNNTQSNCCTSDLRCNRFGMCDTCGPSGIPFNEGNSVASCNLDPNKNFCCNSGSATFDPRSTFCLCP